MRRITFATIAFLAACAANIAPTAEVEQDSSGYCQDGLGPIHCDGYGDFGDAVCSMRCAAEGYQGGWCRHLNSNDDYHGLCASGWAP